MKSISLSNKKNFELILENKKLQEKNHAASLQRSKLFKKKNHKSFLASTIASAKEISTLNNKNKTFIT